MAKIHFRRAQREEREKLERLERAEDTLSDLKIRAERAIRILDERQKRNHWREAIEKIIQGV